MTMHAVMVTFTSAASVDDLAEPFADFARALLKAPGVIAKTWIADGATVGGFYIFTDQASAERYFQSELWRGAAENPAFSDFEIRHFEVLDDLSAITGSPRTLVTQS
jgi:quinol monooxygenase YgiN